MYKFEYGEKLLTIILTVGILIFLALIFGVNIFHFNYKINADIVSDVVLDSKQLIPDSWCI